MNFLLTTGALGTWLDTTFASFDFSIFQFFGSIHSDFLDFVATVFTSMGAVSYAILFAVFGLVLALFKRTRKYGLAIVFAVIIGTLLTNVVIKPMFSRIRPYNMLQDIASYFGWYLNTGMLAESDYCFPSGHTTAAVEIAVALCLCHISDRKKNVAWVFPLIAFLTGCSRVYLMVHYATDVIGGIIIGVLAGVLGYLISRKLTQKIIRSKYNRRIDLERVIWRKFGKRIKRKTVVIIFAAAWLVMMLIAFIPTWKAAHTDVLRCSYEEDYDCYNEAQTGSKYPPIDGKYYCKIHWKELNE